MPTPILATKLYIPPLQPKVVLRPCLIERLNEGLHRRLTLISAPAGFGKTTLVSEWVTSCTRPTVWLSLDEEDKDPTRFLTYLISALQTIVENIGEGVLSVLQIPQRSLIESFMTGLINEIASVPKKLTIVLDDYHVIDAKPIDNALTFLLENLPPQVHLIIATREDPDFPLPRLRARGQLTELRAADLRFTPTEAGDFINQVGLNLSAKDIIALETRTEGWIAGLQLAALSMLGHEDITGFIKSFTGGHHFVMDYLVEEVLQTQSEYLKTFLLNTSILDSMCGSLCDAVLFDQSISGQESLEYIERANLFIIPLDNERRWYRYHHLFADLLRQRLQQSATSSTGDESVKLAELHNRASDWYEDNGQKAKAIHHAFAAKDFERAANLVEVTWAEMDQNYPNDTWLGWVKALPEDLIRVRPVLCVGYAWALLDQGEVDNVEALLLEAERWLNITPQKGEMQDAASAQMVVADKEQFRSLPATIAAARAMRAVFMGDVPGTFNYSQQALKLVPKGDHFRRATITGGLAITYWMTGELEAAYRAFTDCMDCLEMVSKNNFSIGVALVLTDIRCLQGRLRNAISLYEQSLQLAAELDEAVPLVMADLYLGLSVLNREQADVEAATQNLLKSKELGERAALPDWQYRWHLAQARIKETQGDPNGAIELLNKAKNFYISPYALDIRPIAALKTRVLVRMGRLTEAQEWVRERGLSAKDDLNFMQEFEHITLARVLIAEYKAFRSGRSILEATELLERLEKAAEKGGRMGSVIEILVLQALAQEVQNNIPSALTPFARALTIAEPEGYVQIFVDEGIEMARLLSEAAAQKIMPDYTNKLQTIYDAGERKSEGDSPMPPAPHAQSLVEPLSKREIEVLRLIGQGLTNREIGDRLFLALDTVKGHNRNIFGKLQVQRRTEAVARARDLGLL